MARRPLRRRTSCTGSNKPLAAGTPIRRPLSGADVVTCAVNAPISAAIRWVAPVPAPLAPSADVQSLLPTPEPVPRDPLGPGAAVRNRPEAPSPLAFERG